MIIVIAQLRFPDRESRDRAVSLSAPIQQATRDQEHGCQAYCFSADACDPEAIQVYELWQGSESLVAHFEHPNYLSMLEMMANVGVLESISRAYLTHKDEPVYGPNFEKKTAFFAV
jgi:quinol monooxygenase YgiN